MAKSVRNQVAAASAPKTPQRILALLLVVWIAILFIKSQTTFAWQPTQLLWFFRFERFGPLVGSEFIHHWISSFKNLGWLAGFLLAAFGIGRSLLRPWKNLLLPGWERNLYSLGLGFAAISLGMFFLGVFQLYRTPLVAGIFLTLAVWGVWQAWLDYRAGLWRKPTGWFLTQASLLDWLLLLVVAGFLGLAVISANTPETFFDSLVYHLGVPQQWILHHGIKPMPYLFFSNLPFSIEMLYTAGLLVADERLCRLLHVALGCLAAAAIFALATRWFSRRAGVWAAGIFLCVPLVIMNMQCSGVDVAAVFFAILGFGWFLNWCLAEDRPQDAIQPLLAGILIGMSLTSKYNNVFLLAPGLASVLLVTGFREKQLRRLMRGSLIAGLAAFCMLLPWMTKNYVNTGNPVAPFLFKHIPTRYLHPEKMQSQMDGFREYWRRTPVQYLRQPWDLTFYLPTSNSFLNVFFLFALPGFILLTRQVYRRGPPIIQVFYLTALAGVLIWSQATQITRYLIPVIPVLVILIGWMLETVEREYKLFGLLGRLGIVLFAFWGLGLTAQIAIMNWDPMGVALGLENQNAFLDRRLMTSYASMARRINQLPEQVKILIYGETRSYYFERPVVTATVYDRQPLVEMLSSSKTTEELWQALQKAGFTHLFISAQEGARIRGYEPYNFTSEDVRHWNELEARYLNCLAVEPQKRLYAIRTIPQLEQPIKTGRPLWMFDREKTAVLIQHVNQATQYINRGAGENARAAYTRMLELAPDWEEPYIGLAYYYLQQNQRGEALMYYQRAEILAWLDPEVYNNLGALYAGFGNRNEAARCFRIALERNPGLEMARKNLTALEMQKP